MLLVLRRGRVTSLRQLKEILFEDLRIEVEDLADLDYQRISRIHKAHPHSVTKHFLALGES
ncbi:MAG: hypothetical protein KDK65_04660 [Chlamydiia bacterium]|nr:hypothetical protein [Chlamydiia bacterium]